MPNPLSKVIKRGIQTGFDVLNISTVQLKANSAIITLTEGDTYSYSDVQTLGYFQALISTQLSTNDASQPVCLIVRSIDTDKPQFTLLRAVTDTKKLTTREHHQEVTELLGRDIFSPPQS